MLPLHVERDFRLLWNLAPLQQNLYFLFLLAVALITVTFVAQVWRFVNDPTSNRPLAFRRLGTLRQLHLFSLILLQATCADGMFRAIRAIERSKISLSPMGFEAFDTLLTLEFISSALLLLLHSLQWFMPPRLPPRH